MQASRVALKEIPNSDQDSGPAKPTPQKRDAAHRWGSSLILLGASVLIGFTMSGFGIVDLGHLSATFPWAVMTIYIAMEIFTRLIVGTGIMEWTALRLARFSKGKRQAVLALFSLLLFAISATLNNITAAMVILPILFVTLEATKLDRRYIGHLFALLLAICNLGGAATPVGDFPAIIIMKSGLTNFREYLFLALPLFAFTAIVLTVVHVLWLYAGDRKMGTENESDASQRYLGIIFLGVRFRYASLRKMPLALLGFAFVVMFAGWVALPPASFPPEVIAIGGLGLASILVAPFGLRGDLRQFDLEPIMRIGALLFIAAVAHECGLLDRIALLLQRNFVEPKALLIGVMVLTGILSGLFSAGPAAAAMMPVMLSLAEGPLAGQESLLAVAFAAAICAGSSLFLWSATAGLILSTKVAGANLRDEEENSLTWGIRSYLSFGPIHFIIQLGIAITWVLLKIN